MSIVGGGFRWETVRAELGQLTVGGVPARPYLPVSTVNNLLCRILFQAMNKRVKGRVACAWLFSPARLTPGCAVGADRAAGRMARPIAPLLSSANGGHVAPRGQRGICDPDNTWNCCRFYNSVLIIEIVTSSLVMLVNRISVPCTSMKGKGRSAFMFFQ